MLRFLAECWRCVKLAWKYRHLKCGRPSNYAEVEMEATQLAMDLRRLCPGREFLAVPATNAVLDSYGCYVGIWEAVRRKSMGCTGWPIMVPLGFGPVSMMRKYLLDSPPPPAKSEVKLVISHADWEAWKQRCLVDGRDGVSNDMWHKSQAWLAEAVREAVEQIDNDVQFYKHVRESEEQDERDQAGRDVAGVPGEGAERPEGG